MTPTTTPALPSSVTPTMATTPEPSCFLPSSARLLRSFISMPSTARAISLTLPTSRTPLGRRRRSAARAAAHRQLLARIRQVALELLALFHQRGDPRRHVVQRACAARLRPLLRQRHGVVGMLARMAAGQRLDAAHAGGHRAFAGHRNQADIAGAADMGAAAQFDRPAERIAAVLARGLAHRHHAHLVAIFLAEQRAGAGVAGIVDRHQPRGDLVILQHHVVGDILDAAQFLRRDRLRMHEVEAQPIRRHQRAALRDVVAEHLAQRLVQQMRRGMVGADRAAPARDRPRAAAPSPASACPARRCRDGRRDRRPSSGYR